jgi:hypothetical protein
MAEDFKLPNEAMMVLNAAFRHVRQASFGLSPLKRHTDCRTDGYHGHVPFRCTETIGKNRTKGLHDYCPVICVS